jgi:hypothetical protein
MRRWALSFVCLCLFMSVYGLFMASGQCFDHYFRRKNGDFRTNVTNSPNPNRRFGRKFLAKLFFKYWNLPQTRSTWRRSSSVPTWSTSTSRTSKSCKPPSKRWTSTRWERHQVFKVNLQIVNSFLSTCNYICLTMCSLTRSMSDPRPSNKSLTTCCLTACCLAWCSLTAGLGTYLCIKYLPTYI